MYIFRFYYFRCLHITGGSLPFRPKKCVQIIESCCRLHNLAIRQRIPLPRNAVRVPLYDNNINYQGGGNNGQTISSWRSSAGLTTGDNSGKRVALLSSRFFLLNEALVSWRKNNCVSPSRCKNFKNKIQKCTSIQHLRSLKII